MNEHLQGKYPPLTEAPSNAPAIYHKHGAEVGNSPLELRICILVRANYAPGVRNDITGYEVMLGDTATFTAPERTAEMARPFWAEQGGGAQ